MAPVACELSSCRSVLEPLQTATTIEGQVQELKSVLESAGDIPVTLIGFSWGAWLSYIFAAHYPFFVRKLILVSSAPFEERYAESIMETRLNRLGEDERKEALSLMNTMNSSTPVDSNILAQFGKLMAKADSYDLILHNSEILEYSPDVYQRVWEQASKLRSSGELLKLGEKIRCPVVAIHGDYDPHPAEGVREPLSHILKDLRFILLEKCGHHPWLEHNARDRFYSILRSEI